MADDGQLASAGVAAGQGAMAGAALGPWGMAAGAALGAGASLLGASMGGSAASKAAREQQEAAQRWKAYVAKQQSQALGMVLTPSAMAAHDVALRSQEMNVRRQETLAAAMEPIIVEAGKQAMALIQGKSAPVLANIQNQRQVQRQQFLAGLRTQMGPGAETSSAGIQAMQKFDLDTANIMSGAQQQYLDKVSNLSLSGGATLSETMNKATSALSSINANGPEATAARLMAMFTQAGAGAEGAIVNAAGGQHKGEQLMGQAVQQLGNTVIQGAAAVYGKQSVGTTGAVPGTVAGTAASAAAPSNPGASPLTMPQMGSSFDNPQNFSLGANMSGKPQGRPGTLGGAVAGPAVLNPNSGYGPMSGGYGMPPGGGRSNLEQYSGTYMPNYATMPRNELGGVAGGD